MEIELLKKVIQTGKTNKLMASELGVAITTMMHWIKKYALLDLYTTSKKQKDPRLLKERKCPHCDTTKEIEAFARRKDGRPLSWCRICLNAERAKSARIKRRKKLGLGGEDLLHRQKMSAERKKKISERMIKWWADNPERKPWVNSDNKAFKSPPCDKMRQFLKDNGVDFVPEYGELVPGRHFSADIALPDKKLVIEINGNQHYLPNRILRPYYQKRHDLITEQGWTVYEIYYKSCYDEKFLQELLSAIQSSARINEFDYNAYLITNPLVKKKEKPGPLCECGKIMSFKSKRCRQCCSRDNINVGKNIHPRYSNRPQKEELEKLILEMPMTEIAKIYKISDNGVRKWCKFYKIEIKNKRGYWRKRAVGMTHEQALLPTTKKAKASAPPKLTKERAEMFVADILSGMSMRDVVKKYGMTRKGIYERFERIGVPLPKPKRGKLKSVINLAA